MALLSDIAKMYSFWCLQLRYFITRNAQEHPHPIVLILLLFHYFILSVLKSKTKDLLFYYIFIPLFWICILHISEIIWYLFFSILLDLAWYALVLSKVQKTERFYFLLFVVLFFVCLFWVTSSNSQELFLALHFFH